MTAMNWRRHCSSDGKESACNAGDLGLIHGMGRSPGEGNGTPLAVWLGEFHGLYSPWGRKESDMTEWLSLLFNSLWPYGLLPVCPLKSPGKNWCGLPLPSPGDFPDPEDWTGVSCIAGRFFTIWATREAQPRHGNNLNVHQRLNG